MAIFSLALASSAIVSLTKTNPISEIEKLGGKITRTSPALVFDISRWFSNKGWHKSSSWVSRRFGRVVSIDIRSKAFTDEHLTYLKGSRYLTKLYLYNTQISDTGLVYLKDANKLRTLTVWSSQITDTGLVHIKDLEPLENLDLRNTQITDAGLVHLKDLKHLKTLSLGNSQLTDEGLAQLRNLPKLESDSHLVIRA